MVVKLEKKINYLKERLDLENLPGWEAQKKMAAIPINTFTENFFLNPKDYKKAGVAIILFNCDEKLKFYLTKRSNDLEHHKGQISFPGGSIDNKESILMAAAREAEEEIGVQRHQIEYIGSLSPLYIPVSGFKIFPSVWFASVKPRVKLNPKEVSDIFEIELDEVLNEEIVSQKKITLNSKNFNAPAFQFKDCLVWGATAMILSELKEILREI